MLKIILVDDEKPARDRLRLLLEEMGVDIRITGEAANGKEAVEIIREKKPDLIFLDIQMPVLGGFDVVDILGDELPPVIFVTAYDDYAIRAFEIHAVDYLLKPVRKPRLQDALGRVDKSGEHAGRFHSVQKLLQHHFSGPSGRFHKIPVNVRQEIRLLDYDSILYFKADGKLTWAVTGERKYQTDFTLNQLEQRLKQHSFLRIHRSAIVNLDAVSKLEPWFKGGFAAILTNGTELEISRRRVAELKKILGI
ncbi:MAG: LytTR family DNA-binding domain-containing protein [Balneolaceae bacterium]